MKEDGTALVDAVVSLQFALLSGAVMDRYLPVEERMRKTAARMKGWMRSAKRDGKRSIAARQNDGKSYGQPEE